MKSKLTIRILCLLTVHSSIVAFSQDTLSLRNGKLLIGKVIEISDKEVKYKKIENMDGPVYTEVKNEISIIRYKNGISEEFGYVKPWNRVEEAKEVTTLDQKKHEEMRKIGARYWYGDRILNEGEMQDILKETKHPQIICYINAAQKQRGWQYIGFATFPCGLASLYFLSESAGGIFTNNYNAVDKEYENNAKVFALLGLACISTSITLKVKRNQNNAAALKLYKQEFN